MKKQKEKINGLIIEHSTKYDVDALIEYSNQTNYNLFRFNEVYNYKNPTIAGKLKRGVQRSKYGHKYKFTLKSAIKYVLRTIMKSESDSDVRRRIISDFSFEKFKEITEKSNIKFIIIPFEFVWLDNMVKYCKKLGIKLIWMHKEAVTPPDAMKYALTYPFRCDYMCCPGIDYQQLWQGKKGVEAKRITVTGFPRFDFYQQKKKWQTRAQFCKLHGFDSRKKLVFFPSFDSAWAINTVKQEKNSMSIELLSTIDHSKIKKAILRELFKMARKNKDIQVIIKLHPNQRKFEKMDLYEWIAKLGILKNYLVISNDVDPRQIPINVDLIVAYSSTMLIEGLITGTPVISVEDRYVKGGHTMPYYEDKVMPTALTVDKIIPMARELLKKHRISKEFEKGSKKAIYKYMYKQDGKACERVFNVIDKIFKEKELAK